MIALPLTNGSPLCSVVQYEDISENDKRVKYLWKALENFTNGKNGFRLS